MRNLIDVVEDSQIDIFDDLSIAYVVERYGTYIGQTELIDEIVKFMMNHRNYSTFEIEKKDIERFENVFFEKLTIHWENVDNCYSPDDSEFLDDKKLFDIVEIFINRRRTQSYKELAKSIIHEMTHAYQNFCMHINNSDKVLGDVINDVSHSNQIKLANKISSANLSLGTKTIHKYVNELCYFLRKEEQNAFRSELKAEIMSIESSSNLDYKTFANIIRSCETYSNCNLVLSYLDQIQSHKEDNVRMLFAKFFNLIMKKDLSFKEIYRKYSKILQRIKVKLERLGAKIYCEWIESKSRKAIIDKPLGKNEEEIPKSSLNMKCYDEFDYEFNENLDDDVLDEILEEIKCINYF